MQLRASELYSNSPNEEERRCYYRVKNKISGILINLEAQNGNEINHNILKLMVKSVYYGLMDIDNRMLDYMFPIEYTEELNL